MLTILLLGMVTAWAGVLAGAPDYPYYWFARGGRGGPEPWTRGVPSPLCSGITLVVHPCTGLLWGCMLATRHWPGPHRLSGGPALLGRSLFYSGGALTGALPHVRRQGFGVGLLGKFLPWSAVPSASSYRGEPPPLSSSPWRRSFPTTCTEDKAEGLESPRMASGLECCPYGTGGLPQVAV